MLEIDSLSEYNKILLSHNRTNGAVYSKIYFKVEICSAHKIVACQRYLCPYVIPMTMNAFIFKNLSLKTVLLNHMSK